MSEPAHGNGPWSRTSYDAVIIGSGPNGLSAAVELGRAGLSTLVLEARDSPGGGARTQELTLPGFWHDVCSTVHPLGAASPFFRSLDLSQFGLSWVHSPAPVAHVLGDGRAVTLERSVEETAAQLGSDGAAYRELMEPFTDRFDELAPMVLAGLRMPNAPVLFARFGLSALRSLKGLARAHFQEQAAGALLAGIAAHAMLPLDELATASFGLVLGTAGHAVGWPIARGGSRSIVNALIACLEQHGGEVVTGFNVEHFEQLPPAQAYLFDTTPRQMLSIAGHRLSPEYRRKLRRFRHGPGVYKMDWALRAPLPWKDPTCARASTVHLMGNLDQISAAERSAHSPGPIAPPFVLVVQPTLFDPERAPDGMHIAWAYCHVPHGSELDASAAIEGQLERAAPGFRELVLARRCVNARELERYNPNFVGGDIAGGMSNLAQLFFRPTVQLDPYATSARDMFLCSSSTPPGGGVHGMCGYWAAQSALRKVFRHTEGSRSADRG